MNLKTISNSRWLDIISSPYLMALFIAAVIILFLPEIFNKYEAELLKADRSHKPNSIEEYHDLDGDGYSERVLVYNNSMGQPAMQVLSNDGSTIEQWNFTGRYPERQGHMKCGDLDNNGVKEIYIFTIKSDTLLLSAIAPFSDTTVLFRNKFITTIQYCNDTIQAFVGQGYFADMNGDDYSDLIFSVKAGFSRQPRGVYVYDDHNDSVYHSLIFGANLGEMIIEDFNEDGKPEIFHSCNTLGNIHDSLGIPYSDYSAYIMGFDHNLNFLFPPIEYPIYPSSSSITHLRINGENLFAVYFKNRSIQDDPSELKLINKKGEILKELYIEKDDPILGNQHKIKRILAYNENEGIALLGKTKTVILDQNLEVTDIIEIEGAKDISLIYDLNQDGIKEMIFYEANQHVLITQPYLKDPLYIESFRDPFSSIPFCISIKENGDNHPELFLKSDNRAYFYTYKSNMLYYLKYPIWFGIYLFSLFIIMLIRNILKTQLQRKMALENRMNALQLKTIKSQMDPHFMFNALNSISINILNNENDIAYRYLVKYSNLLRSLFTKADKLAIGLGEELSFVEQYLELEQFRFNEKLSYDINIDPNTDQSIQIPRMLIQLFVENAIKHGLRHKEEMGHISIMTEQKNDHLLLLIIDDGIGRKAAKKKKAAQGVGLKIIDEMIVLYEKTSGTHIRYQYEDLEDCEEKPCGTKVIVIIPS